MRTLPYLSAAVAALGLILSAPRAEAITNTAPAGIRAGIETIDLVEPVHCRRFRHGHRYGHGWSRGCRIGVIVAPARRSVVIRERGGFRTGPTFRSRTTIHTRSGPDSRTTTRRSGGDAGPSTTIRSGTGRTPAQGTSTTTAPAPSTGTGGKTAPATSTTPSSSAPKQ
jgi:hypothetical protein